MTAAEADAFVVGGWELLEGLRGDAVSETWIARESAGQRRVARLLRLKDAAAEKTGLGERFLAHVRAAAKVRHPLLARILVVGSEPTPWIVSERFDGANLVDVAAGEKLPIGVALRMVLDAALATGALHSASPRLVHGAIRADHVVVTAGGIATLLPGGTGAEADPRVGSDVRDLAVLLWELLSGRSFEKGQRVEASEDVPKAVIELLEQSLSDDGKRRPADGAAFAAALEDGAGDAVADRAAVAEAFRIRVGNDVAARRLERESLIEAADAARESQTAPQAPAAEPLAEAASAEPASEPATAEPVAKTAGPAAAAAAAEDASAGDDDDGDDEQAEAGNGAPRTAAERRAAKRARKRAARRDRTATETPTVVVMDRKPERSSERPVALAPAPAPAAATPQGKRPVRAVVAVLGAAAALLLVGLVMRASGVGTEPETAPVLAPTHAPAAAAPPRAAAPTPAPLPEPPPLGEPEAPEPEPEPSAKAPAPADRHAGTGTAVAAEPGASHPETPAGTKPGKLSHLPAAAGIAKAPRPAAPAAAPAPPPTAVRAFDVLPESAPPAAPAPPPAAPPAPTIPPAI